jgi:hypothetical protein
MLAAISSGILATAAGCSSSRPNNVDQNRYQKPEIPITDRWIKREDIRIPQKIVTLGAYTAGEIYTDTKLGEYLDIVPGGIEQPLAAFFAAQVNLFQANIGGDLLYGIANSQRVLNRAEPRIRRRLRQQFNLENLDVNSSSGPKPNRSTAHRELTGSFPINRTEEVTLDNGSTEQVMLSGAVPVRILSSCWRIPDSEDLLLVGGAYPESSQIVLKGPLTSAQGIGIDVTVTINLGFNPREIRARILERSADVSAINS